MQSWTKGLVPPPKRRIIVYSGVLASNSRWRRLIIPKAQAMKENGASENAEGYEVPAKPIPGPMEKAEAKPKVGISKYIPWHELLRRTFGGEVRCPDCDGKLKLIALVKKDETIRKIHSVIPLPTGLPKVVKPGPIETTVSHEESLEWGGDAEDEKADWPEVPDGLGGNHAWEGTI